MSPVVDAVSLSSPGAGAVRAKKQFRIGKIQSIPARFCRKLQLADGFDYAVVETTLHLQAIPTPCLKKGTPASSPRLKTGASAGEIR